jgi:hypothetical protein
LGCFSRYPERAGRSKRATSENCGRTAKSFAAI